MRALAPDEQAAHERRGWIVTIDLTDAVTAAARASHKRTQDARMDAGRLKDDGTPITWDDLTPHDQHAYREFVLPIVTAAAPLIEAQVREASA